MRKVLLVGLAVLAVLVGIGLIVGDGDKDKGDTPVLDEGPNALALAANCGSLDRVDTSDLTPKHRAGMIDYADVPPNSGDHAPQTLRNAKRFYSRQDNPNAEQAVHNLEHGLVVAWYDNELPAAEVAKLESVSQGMGSRFVTVPWTRSVFGGDRHFALTAWGVTQRCATVSAAHIEDFVKTHADGKAAPEAGYSV